MREVIRSKQNAQFKVWRKLHTSKGRKQSQAYLVEGDHLVEEAMGSKAQIIELIVSEDYQRRLNLEGSAFPVRVIDKQLSDQLSQTEAPQGIFAHIAMTSQQEWSWQGRRYLLMDRVQDPGNVGTMIRTADAANYDGVILGQGSVDLYNDKLIRSAQGSIWHIPILEMNLVEAAEKLKKQGVQVIATALNPQAVTHMALEAQKAYAFILGNEGQGVSAEILEAVDQEIYIPMPGRAESLNVAIAAGIILFTYPND